jgi:hypothetical protein
VSIAEIVHSTILCVKGKRQDTRPGATGVSAVLVIVRIWPCSVFLLLFEQGQINNH